MYPDFLVVGAQKAGTTWLYRSLRTHPQVWMPREKELHYFDEKIRLDGGSGPGSAVIVRPTGAGAGR